MVYTLYKHPIQDDTLAIVRYIDHKKYMGVPIICVERNHGIEDNALPAIHDHDTDVWYYGIDNVVSFYQKMTGLKDILHRAMKFHKRHPDYVIHHPKT